MNITIKNKKQEIIFETDNVGKAYSFLKDIVPENHLCTYETLKLETSTDQQLEISEQRYMFYLDGIKDDDLYMDGEHTDCVYMDVEYESK